MFLLFIVLLTICIYLVYKLLCARYFPPVVKDVPTFHHKLPFYRKFRMITPDDLFDLMANFTNHCTANGGVTKMLIGPCPLYVITNADDASTILNKCMTKMWVYKIVDRMFGSNLVSAEYPIWRQNRRVLDRAFKQNVLKSYTELFNNQAAKLVAMLDKEVGAGEVDLTDTVTRNVLETLFKTTTGLGLDQLGINCNEYVRAVHTVFEIMTVQSMRPWLMFDFLFKLTRYKKQFEDNLNRVYDVSRKVVGIRKAEYLKRLHNNKDFSKQVTFQSFLDIILENMVRDGDDIFTDEQLRDLVDNIFLAGFDTSTYELLLTLVCIGTHVEVQEKIYNEIMQVMGEEEKVKKEHILQLVYLEAVIKEALRLYPIAAVIGRQCDKDTKLTNFTLPAGSNCVISLYGINRNHQAWGQDADDFKPERWLTPGCLPKHPEAFSSFSTGKRNCIGKSYAMQYLKTTLVPIVRSYRLSSDHKNMKLKLYIMIKVCSGHLIKIERR